MQQRAIIVHGWEGTPESNWFPWLKKELEIRGFEVSVPQLPDPNLPRIEKWIPALSDAIGNPDKETHLIGHSMGCQAIVRYLTTLPEDIHIGGAVFVAGFFKRLTGLEDDPEVQETDRHWLETPVDMAYAATKMRESVAIFSDDDPYVPLDNQDDFRDTLGSEIKIFHNMNHFNASTGTTQLPAVLEALLKFSKN